MDELQVMQDYHDMMEILSSMGLEPIPYKEFVEIWKEEMLNSAGGTKH